MSTGDEDDDGYERQRKYYGSVSGSYRVAATDTGLVTLVPAQAKTTLVIQQVHADVTTGATSELWGLQDGATTPVPIVGTLSAAAVAHADRDFGATGVPCTEGTAFTLNVSGATGAIGWIAWEGYRKLTRAAVVSPPLVRYSELVIADGASYYWRLEETSGTTAVDSIGGVNGTISGGVTLNQPGALSDGSKGMTFNGSTGQIVPPAGSVPLPYSWEVWMKTTAATGPLQPILSSYRTPFTGDAGILTQAANGGVNMSVIAAGVNAGGTVATVPLNDGVWHHLAVVVQATQGTIYVDGVQKVSSALGPLALTSQVPTFGWRSDNATFFNGSLDDVALYPSALTAAQVSAHYLAGITR